METNWLKHDFIKKKKVAEKFAEMAGISPSSLYVKLDTKRPDNNFTAKQIEILKAIKDEFVKDISKKS